MTFHDDHVLLGLTSRYAAHLLLVRMESSFVIRGAVVLPREVARDRFQRCCRLLTLRSYIIVCNSCWYAYLEVNPTTKSTTREPPEIKAMCSEKLTQ